MPSWSDRYLAGTNSARLPYSVDALEAAGLSLEIPGLGSPTQPWAWRQLERRAGHPVEATLRAWRPAKSSDAVLALLEHEAQLALRMRHAGVGPFARIPLVVWSWAIGQQLRGATAEHREAIRRKYSAADLVTVMSRHEVGSLVEAGFNESRVFPVNFGVSHDYFTPNDEVRDIEVLAVGQDHGRDYATLFDAVRETDLRVTLVCRPHNLQGQRIPDNVELLAPVPHNVYRDLLRRAQVLAVPTLDLSYPTGSSVALEGSSSGCCVVGTNTIAMSEYIDDGVNGTLLPVGDSSAWRETLLKLRADDAARARLGSAARDNVITRFNAEAMWLELAQHMRSMGIV